MTYRSERFLRLAAGMTQKDIADRAGVSVTTIHHFEVNTNNIRPNTEERIKAVYEEIYDGMRHSALVLALAMELKYATRPKEKKRIKEDIYRYLDRV